MDLLGSCRGGECKGRGALGCCAACWDRRVGQAHGSSGAVWTPQRTLHPLSNATAAWSTMLLC